MRDVSTINWTPHRLSLPPIFIKHCTPLPHFWFITQYNFHSLNNISILGLSWSTHKQDSLFPSFFGNVSIPYLLWEVSLWRHCSTWKWHNKSVAPGNSSLKTEISVKSLSTIITASDSNSGQLSLNCVHTDLRVSFFSFTIRLCCSTRHSNQLHSVRPF